MSKLVPVERTPTPSARPCLQPRSAAVLVPVDLSRLGVHAAWRAALVARDLGCALRLLHAEAGRDERGATERSLRQLASQIRGHTGVRVELVEDPDEPLQATARAARDAALVVVGGRRGNPLREWVLGTPAERLLRLCRVPVLVVKKPPAGAYRRVLVPVELAPAAAPVIAAAARLSRGPRMEVLHALRPGDEFGMRVFDLPEQAVRRLRRRAADRTERALEELIAQSVPQPDAALPAVGFGDPAAQVLARSRAMRADLLVLGKRRRARLADFFLGGVTQRVLAAAQVDVLLVPPEGAGEALGFACALTPAYANRAN
ncbi:universal stress protein [Ramlibacter alkalitolerans]|uniref:Universal stress protein n=1 Tax=Ramlibacter alkalitolerans TaxID=2039631 RepID=A0ABS1JK58_9BURK|nr:universal stress protein [Ramlibacter alkalitolerans]MBL0424491.1 universal stress protein [Ramlibacter alkalitolerans]